MFGLCHIQVKNEVPLEREFNEKSNQDSFASKEKGHIQLFLIYVHTRHTR